MRALWVMAVPILILPGLVAAAQPEGAPPEVSYRIRTDLLQWSTAEVFDSVGLRITILEDGSPRACDLQMWVATIRDEGGLAVVGIRRFPGLVGVSSTSIVRPHLQLASTSAGSSFETLAAVSGIRGAAGQGWIVPASEMVRRPGDLLFELVTLNAQPWQDLGVGMEHSVSIDLRCERPVTILLAGTRNAWIASQTDFPQVDLAVAPAPVQSVVKDAHAHLTFEGTVDFFAWDMHRNAVGEFAIDNGTRVTAWPSTELDFFDHRGAAGAYDVSLTRVSGVPICASCIDLFGFAAASWVPMRSPQELATLA